MTLVFVGYALGIIIVTYALYKAVSYFGGKQFYEKLEKFIERDLTEDDVKLIANRVNKYPLPHNNYCWEVLIKTTVEINQLDISKDVIKTFNMIAEKKELDVKKVLESHDVTTDHLEEKVIELKDKETTESEDNNVNDEEKEDKEV